MASSSAHSLLSDLTDTPWHLWAPMARSAT